MIAESIALLGFFGVIILTAVKIFDVFINSNEKRNPWISVLFVAGILFFWGLFSVSWFSSFTNETVVTKGTQTITISDNEYFVLTQLSFVLNGVAMFGILISFIDFVRLLFSGLFSNAKNSHI